MKKQNIGRAVELNEQLVVLEAAEKILRRDQECSVIVHDTKELDKDVKLPHRFVYDLLGKVRASINVINNEIETL